MKKATQLNIEWLLSLDEYRGLMSSESLSSFLHNPARPSNPKLNNESEVGSGTGNTAPGDDLRQQGLIAHDRSETLSRGELDGQLDDSIVG